MGTIESSITAGSMKSRKLDKKPKPNRKAPKIVSTPPKEKSQPVTNYCRDCEIPEGLDW